LDLLTVLSSAVVAGLVAGLVTLRTSERKIAIENITQQRQLWREKIRDLSLKIKSSYKSGNKDELNAQYVEMQLLLNPLDRDDKCILDTIWAMLEEAESAKLHIVLAEKLSLLLKHDWERAKLEAKPVWYMFHKVKRVPYEKSKFKRITS
jgi:hypothetical protein